MAVPGADLRLVDPLAADLIYFSGSMRLPRVRLPMTSATVALGAIGAAGVLMAMAPLVRAGIHSGCPASGPCPTPTPIGANIVLDVAAGGPSTVITAIGTYFLPNESMSLYWDTPSHVASSVVTDGAGSFSKALNPFPGDSPGVHRLCASVEPHPCANFTLQGAPTPTPPASPSPSASPSASASPSQSPGASPVVLTTNSGRSGLDVITKPPFVFLPIIGLLALLAALAYWLLMRVDRPPVLPAASVVHRSARPDIGPVAAPHTPPPVVPQATEPEPPAAPPAVETPPVSPPEVPPESQAPPEPPPY